MVEPDSNRKSQIANRRSSGLWIDAWRRLRRNRAAIVAAAVLAFMIAVAATTHWIAPYDRDAQSLQEQYQPPSWKHWMGTDLKGRDLMTRVMYGARVSFAVGFAATFVSVVIGVAWGSVAGFIGGKVDDAMMRIVDILYGLPYMFVVMILMTWAGRQIIFLFLGLGLVEWLTMSRIVRGQVISLKQKEFVEAARAVGAGAGRIIVRHILPNLIGPVIVYSTLTVPRVMLSEAFLSFLGLGVQAPAASWGSLAAEGADATSILRTYGWLIAFPGGALTITLFALNFLGDGLRDALDPRLKK